MTRLNLIKIKRTIWLPSVELNERVRAYFSDVSLGEICIFTDIEYKNRATTGR